MSRPVFSSVEEGVDVELEDGSGSESGAVEVVGSGMRMVPSAFLFLLIGCGVGSFLSFCKVSSLIRGEFLKSWLTISPGSCFTMSMSMIESNS